MAFALAGWQHAPLNSAANPAAFANSPYLSRTPRSDLVHFLRSNFDCAHGDVSSSYRPLICGHISTRIYVSSKKTLSGYFDKLHLRGAQHSIEYLASLIAQLVIRPHTLARDIDQARLGQGFHMV